MTEVIQKARDEIATPPACNDLLLTLRGVLAPKQSQPPKVAHRRDCHAALAMTEERGLAMTMKELSCY